jgi:hypothetical protein
MKIYHLSLVALFSCCSSVVFAQQRPPKDSAEILLQDTKRMVHVVDSLRNLSLDRYNHWDNLKNTPVPASRTKQIARERAIDYAQARLDSVLTPLDSCTQVLDKLNSRLDSLNKRTAQPSPPPKP